MGTRKQHLIITLAIAALAVPFAALAEDGAKSPGKEECKQHYRPDDDPTVSMDVKSFCESNQHYIQKLSQTHEHGKKICVDTTQRFAQLKTQYEMIKAKGLSNAFNLRSQIGASGNASETQLLDQAKQVQGVAADNARDTLRLIETVERQFKERYEELGKQIKVYGKVAEEGQGYSHDDNSPGGVGQRCKSEREFYAGFVTQLSGELKRQQRAAEHYIQELQRSKVNHVKILKSSGAALTQLQTNRQSLESANGSPDDGILGRVGSSVKNLFSGDNWEEDKNCESSQGNGSDNPPTNCYRYNPDKNRTLSADDQKFYDEFIGGGTPQTTADANPTRFSDMQSEMRDIFDESGTAAEIKPDSPNGVTVGDVRERPSVEARPLETATPNDPASPAAAAVEPVAPTTPREGYHGLVDEQNNGKLKPPMDPIQQAALIEQLNTSGSEQNKFLAGLVSDAKGNKVTATTTQNALADAREQAGMGGVFVVDGQFGPSSFRETDECWSNSKCKSAFIENLRSNGFDVPQGPVVANAPPAPATGASTAPGTQSAAEVFKYDSSLESGDPSKDPRNFETVEKPKSFKGSKHAGHQSDPQRKVPGKASFDQDAGTVTWNGQVVGQRDDSQFTVKGDAAEAARLERNQQVMLAQRTPASQRTEEQRRLIDDWNYSTQTANSGQVASDVVYDSNTQSKLDTAKQDYERELAEARKAKAEYDSCKSGLLSFNCKKPIADEAYVQQSYQERLQRIQSTAGARVESTNFNKSKAEVADNVRRAQNRQPASVPNAASPSGPPACPRGLPAQTIADMITSGKCVGGAPLLQRTN